jgi:hypothetical protein
LRPKVASSTQQSQQKVLPAILRRGCAAGKRHTEINLNPRDGKKYIGSFSLQRKFLALVSYPSFSIGIASQTKSTSLQLFAGSLLSIQRNFTDCLAIDFEAIQDDIIRSPDSEELANYEQYSRRELPRFFRSALEAAIADEAQPIEERLRSRLVGMIQDCQDRVFSTYKSRRGSGTPSSNVVAENTSLEQLSSPLPMRHGKASIPEGTDNATGILETFYERPPPQIHVQPYSDVVLGSSIPNAIELNTSTNLGCASDLSLHNSQSLSMEQMSVSGTATASGSQTQQFPDTPQLPEDFNAGINYPFPFKNGTDGHSYSYESGNIPIPVLSMEDCCELDERLDNFDFDKWMLNAR